MRRDPSGLKGMGIAEVGFSQIRESTCSPPGMEARLAGLVRN
jgi:hypothetical protein